MEIARMDEIIRQIRALDAALRSEAFVDSVTRAIDDSRAIDFDLKSYSSTQLTEIPKGPGVYIFYVRFAFRNGNSDWKRQFQNDWMHPDMLGFQNSPAVITSKLQKIGSPEWVPLYLGKSEHMQQRVLSHIELDGSKRTFALKLMARANKIQQHQFRVKYWHLDAFPGMQILLRILEEELRARIEPITGRQ